MWGADGGWGELVQAGGGGMPTEASEAGVCLLCSWGSKEAPEGGLEESRTVKGICTSLRT